MGTEHAQDGATLAYRVIAHHAFRDCNEIATEHAQEGTTCAYRVDAIAALYSSSDAWFGASEQVLGAHVDHWADIGLDAGLSFEKKVGRGTFFSEIGGVYTS